MPSSLPKTFFTLPTTIYPPDGLIRLGQVIKDPIYPFQRVAPPLELTGKLTPQKSRLREFAATSSQTGAVSVGLMAHLLDTVKGELSARRGATETLTWKAAVLETHYFEPDEDPTLIAQLQEDKAVRQWLRKVRLPGKSAYLITGLKIAVNPGVITCETFDEAAIQAQLQAIVDPQGLVKAGLEASAARSAAAAVEGTPENSYVFAYQLREIKVNPVTAKASIGGFRKGGEVFGADDESAPEESDSDGYCFDSSDEEQEEEEEEDDGGEDRGTKLDNKLSLSAADFGSELPASAFLKQNVDLDNTEENYLLVSTL